MITFPLDVLIAKQDNRSTYGSQEESKRTGVREFGW
jgi:hypothetical protein